MSSRSGVRVAGPLAVFAPGFGEGLAARGYRPGPAADQLRLIADVSRWLAERGLGAGDLTAVAAERFSAERRASGRVRLASARALSPLLGYLRELGLAPSAVPAAPLTPAEALIERYSMYLLERRGLAPSTVRNYVGVARVFLSWRETAAGALGLAELDGAAVSEFVLRESRRSSVGSAKCMVTRLRALLRFLHVEGEIEWDLAGAVPSVASWRLASLVKALDARSVARLLSSCDRRTRVGRRDFAVLTMLSRLGLRAGEIAALRLADVDWRPGEVLIRGKGSRQERLPLPLMSVRRWPAGWVAAVRAARRRSCSRACAPRLAALRRALSRRSCDELPSGAGADWLLRPPRRPACRRSATVGGDERASTGRRARRP